MLILGTATLMLAANMFINVHCPHSINTTAIAKVPKRETKSMRRAQLILHNEFEFMIQIPSFVIPSLNIAVSGQLCVGLSCKSVRDAEC